MFRIFPLPVLALLATDLHAGAWPREEGMSFLSFTVEADTDDIHDSFASLYFERGIGGGRAAGLDLGGDEESMYKAIAFLRWPLSEPDSLSQIAFEMGAGVVEDQFTLRPGLSVGRGYTLGERQGWLAVDSRALIYEDWGEGLLETDFTAGLNTGDRTKVLMQVQTGVPTGDDAYVKLAPSLLYQQKPGRHVLLGVTAGVVEVDSLTVNFGFWQEF